MNLTPGVYDDQQLVPRALQLQLQLYTALSTSSPCAKLGSLGKCASLLNTIPKVRAFDCRKSHRPSEDFVFPPNLTQILLDRATTYKTLADAYVESCDWINAIANYRRSVELLEDLLASGFGGECKENACTLIGDAVDRWARAVRESGNAALAEKIRNRANKWK